MLSDERYLPQLDKAKQLAGQSGREAGFFLPAPIAPESRAARATASGCPAGSVSLSLVPRIQLAPFARHGKRKRGFDLDALTRRDQALKPLPLPAALPQDCRKPLVAPRHSPAILPHFPCCQPGYESTARLVSSRALPR